MKKEEDIEAADYVTSEVSVLNCKFQLLESNIQSTNISMPNFFLLVKCLN